MNAQLKPQAAIPEGYRVNAVGHLVPESLIRESDKLRDETVNAIMARAKELRAVVAGFKRDTYAEVLAFVDLMAQDYGTEIGGSKGNIRLTSFDGKRMVEIAVAQIKGFDEKIHVAKSLIDECINAWGESARPEVRMLLGQAFQTDSAGNLNHGRIFGLMRLEIEDGKWQDAMKALRDSIQVYGSKSYVRLYEREAPDQKFVQVSLDFSAL